MEMMRAVLDTNSGSPPTSSSSPSATPRCLSPACSPSFTSCAASSPARSRPSTARDAGPHGLWHCLLRHALQLRRHHSGRHLGRPILGPLLGLGPQGKRRPADRPLERHHPARPLGRPDQGTRPHGHGRLRQHRHQLLLVRRQHARHRPALLRLHGQGLSLADALRRQPGRAHRSGADAARHWASFKAAAPPAPPSGAPAAASI